MRKLTASALLLFVLAPTLALAAAGITDRQISQFPPPDFDRQPVTIQLTGPITASTAKIVSFKNRDAWFLYGVHAVARAMSGTITAFTLDLQHNTMTSMKNAIDMYSTGLASAGTIQDGTLYLPTDLVRYPAGTTFTVDVVLTGTDTPTVNDITIQLDTRIPVGLEP